MPVKNRLDYQTRVGLAHGPATDSRQRTIAESVGRSNKHANMAAAFGKAIGTALLLVGLAISIHRLWTSSPSERGEVLVEEAMSWALGYALAVGAFYLPATFFTGGITGALIPFIASIFAGWWGGLKGASFVRHHWAT